MTTSETQSPLPVRKDHPPIPIRYLNIREAAAYLGRSYRTLEDWLRYGGGPAHIRVPDSSSISYDIDDLDEFMGRGRCAASERIPPRRRKPTPAQAPADQAEPRRKGRPQGSRNKPKL